MTTDSIASPLTLSALLDSLPPGARLLDLGCGSGSFKYDQLPHLKISALDANQPAAAQTFPPHVEFKLGMATAIPEPDNSFDCLVANFAFEHFPDPAAALREIDRVLRDGAFAWISMPNAASFEDQLYRNLFSGGGHLQRPSIEWFLRLAYAHTSLKLVSFIEIPAGFNFLGETPQLRFFTWAVVDAICRSLSRDVTARSGCIYILRKFASAGPGYIEHLHTCTFCGSPHGNREGAADSPWGQPWDCPECGAHNAVPNSIPLRQLDEVERAVSAIWERFPETSPEQLKKMLEERTEWARSLDREVEQLRETAREVEQLRETVRELQAKAERHRTLVRRIIHSVRKRIGGSQAKQVPSASRSRPPDGACS